MFHRISRSDTAGKRNNRRSLFKDGSEYSRLDDWTRLGGVDDAAGIERRSLKELVRIEFLQGGGIYDRRLHVAGDSDNRSALLARIHQPVEQMDDARAGSSTNNHRRTSEKSIGYRGKYAVLFIANVDELDFAVSPQSVDDGIQSVADNAVTTFYSGVCQHLPQNICYGF